MKLFYTLLFFLASSWQLWAAEVDTVAVFSASMQKSIKTVVITPAQSIADKKLPTLYLLHGYGGRYDDYVRRVDQLQDWVDQYQVVVVCPDGGHGSWYWDIPGDDQFQYETFVAKELVSYITDHYKVHNESMFRAITGFSMGGHGALYLALRHQDVFGAVGSVAGGVDIRPFPNNWDIAKRLGTYAENREAWSSRTIMEMLHLMAGKTIPVFIDCGRQDFFYPVNLRLHQKMDELNIPHHYHSMPGAHNWAYVNQSLNYQFAFFNEAFRRVK